MGIPAPIGVAACGLPPLGDQANAVLSGTLSAIGPGLPFAFRGPMNLLIWAAIATTLATTKGSLTATAGSGTGLGAGNSISSVNVPRGATIGALSTATITLALPTVCLYASGISVSGPNITLPPGSNVNSLLGATVTVPSTAEQVALPANTTVLAIVQADVAPSANSPGVPGIVQLSANPTAAPPNTVPLQPLNFALGANAVTVTGTDANASFTGAAIDYVGTVQVERSFDGGFTWVVCNIGGAGELAQFAAGTPISVTFGEPEKDVLYRLNCIAYSSGTINYRISQTGGAAESLAIGPLSGG